LAAGVQATKTREIFSLTVVAPAVVGPGLRQRLLVLLEVAWRHRETTVVTVLMLRTAQQLAEAVAVALVLSVLLALH
jgi:hypothetical protein